MFWNDAFYALSLKPFFIFWYYSNITFDKNEHARNFIWHFRESIMLVDQQPPFSNQLMG